MMKVGDLVIVMIGAGALALSTQSCAAHGSNNPLHLVAKVESVTVNKGAALHIYLQNDSAQTACVGQRAFDAVSSGIMIWNFAGREILPGIAGHPYTREIHGFDYAQPYFVLPPRKSLDFYLDLKVFKVASGLYRFDWPIPYFKCDEIVHLENSNSEIFSYAFHVSGQFKVDMQVDEKHHP